MSRSQAAGDKGRRKVLSLCALFSLAVFTFFTPAASGGESSLGMILSLLLQGGESGPPPSTAPTNLNGLPSLPSGDQGIPKPQADQYRSYLFRYMWGDTVWFRVSNNALSSVIDLTNNHIDNKASQFLVPVRRDCANFDIAVEGLRKLVRGAKDVLLENLSRSGIQMSNGMWDVTASRGAAVFTARKLLNNWRYNWDAICKHIKANSGECSSCGRVHYLFDDEPVARIGALRYWNTDLSRINHIDRVAGAALFNADKTPETREHPYRSGEPKWQIGDNIVLRGDATLVQDFAYTDPVGLELLNSITTAKMTPRSFLGGMRDGRGMADSTDISPTTYIIQAAAGGAREHAFLHIYPDKPWNITISVNGSIGSDREKSFGYAYAKDNKSVGTSARQPGLPFRDSKPLKSENSFNFAHNYTYSCKWENVDHGNFPNVKITETKTNELSGRLRLGFKWSPPGLNYWVVSGFLYGGLEGGLDLRCSRSRDSHANDQQKPPYRFDSFDLEFPPVTARLGVGADFIHEEVLSIRGGAAASFSMRRSPDNYEAAVVAATDLECAEFALEGEAKVLFGKFSGKWTFPGPFPIARVSLIEDGLNTYDVQLQMLIGR